MPSIIYNVGGTDKTLILDTRAQLLQPFKATNWFDVRLSLMLSLTKQSDPNDPTGLSETIGAGEDNNNFYIGFKSSDTFFPTGSNFFGLTSKALAFATSPAGVADAGTYNTIFSGGDTSPYFLISNGVSRANDTPHILAASRYQNSLAGTYPGYATLLMFQMKRSDPSLTQVDFLGVSLNGGVNFDNGLPFDTDTSTAHIRAVTAAASYAQIFGGFNFAVVPNAIYLYWPFTNSRVRIHNYVLEKYA